MHATSLPRVAAGLAAVLLALAPTLSRAGAEPPDTLYAELGGAPGVAAIVEAAEAAFLADGRISAAFEDVNMPRLKRLLAEKICEVSDGGCRYTGHSLRAAHKGLHIRMRDFNAVVEDLQGAMDRRRVPFSTQNRLLARLAPMQRDVVTR